MPQFTRERRGEYLKAAIELLNGAGGDLPSGELIKQIEQTVKPNQSEKSLNTSGQLRWITNFRFNSVGLVKAGWVEKSKGKWILTSEGKQHVGKTSLQILDAVDDAYATWLTRQGKNEISTESLLSSDEEEEPELLMDVKPDDIAFDSLLDGISTGRIQIPPFQRSFVWSPNDIRNLLDSIYRGYPIGSFIFWKTSRKLPHTRTIGNLQLPGLDTNAGSQISYVLDGQQRITSLFSAVKGSMIDGEYYRFLFDLRSKKFLVQRSTGENQETSDIENHLLPINTLFSGLASYDRVARVYPENYREVLVTLYDRFARYRFSVIDVIDVQSSEPGAQDEGVRQVVRMFSRINETGRKLTVVAKMVARCWGEGFDLREKLDDFFEQNTKLSSIREETVLQVASVILNYRKCRTRDILERTNIQRLAADWDSITETILLAADFIRQKVRIENFSYLPFDALLVPLAYCLSREHAIINDHARSELLTQWFWQASLSGRYNATLESRIEEDCIYMDQLVNGEQTNLSYFIDWDSLKDRLIAQPYNLHNAFVKTVLSLYAHAGPLNLADGARVSVDGAFTGYFKHNLHHIFPQAYLRRNHPDQQKLFDSIVNVMLIPALANISISDASPSNYFSEFQKKNDRFKDILSTHFIPDLGVSGILQDDYLKFLDYRAERITQALRVRAGVTSVLEADFDQEPTRPVDILESRIRSFIHERLQTELSGSYWEDCIPADIRSVVDKKIEADLKRYPYKLEEYLRDEVRISFLDIMDYSKIILTNWDVFQDRFGTKGDVERHFVAFKNYRNSIKHVRLLDDIDRRNGEAAMLWIERALG